MCGWDLRPHIAVSIGLVTGEPPAGQVPFAQIHPIRVFGSNPIASRPRHRVVRGDQWGLARKRTLLQREAGPRVGELF
jgi:hypothetical protein